METAKEDDGIEYGWLIVIPEDETAATGGKPAAIEGADDEADETGGDGGVELRTSDKEVAWPVSLKKKDLIFRFRCNLIIQVLRYSIYYFIFNYR